MFNNVTSKKYLRLAKLAVMQHKNYCEMHNQTPTGKFPESFSRLEGDIVTKYFYSNDLLTDGR